MVQLIRRWRFFIHGASEAILDYSGLYCLPIVAAGSSSAFIRRLTDNSYWQMTGLWFRRMAGAVIALLGIYFIANPIFATV